MSWWGAPLRTYIKYRLYANDIRAPHKVSDCLLTHAPDGEVGGGTVLVTVTEALEENGPHAET